MVVLLATALTQLPAGNCRPLCSFAGSKMTFVPVTALRALMASVGEFACAGQGECVSGR
jgi:hypothetical protein